MRGRLAKPAFLFMHFGPLATKNKRRGTSFARPNVVSSPAVVGVRRFGTVLCREVLRTAGLTDRGLGTLLLVWALVSRPSRLPALMLSLAPLVLDCAPWVFGRWPGSSSCQPFAPSCISFQCSGPLTSCPAPPRAGVWPFQATSAARDRAEPLKSADVQITVGTRVRRERGHLTRASKVCCDHLSGVARRGGLARARQIVVVDPRSGEIVDMLSA